MSENKFEFKIIENKDRIFDKEIYTKGYMCFFYDVDGMNYYTREWEDEFEQQYRRDFVYDLFDGERFLNDVRSNGFNNYDGHISEIYVDGYKTNLGLYETGICQGKFIVSGDVFEYLCKNHDVKVNWANK